MQAAIAGFPVRNISFLPVILRLFFQCCPSLWPWIILTIRNFDTFLNCLQNVCSVSMTQKYCNYASRLAFSKKGWQRHLPYISTNRLTLRPGNLRHALLLSKQDNWGSSTRNHAILFFKKSPSTFFIVSNNISTYFLFACLQIALL